ncbi:MAG: hypothetical protein ACR2OX_04135 [Methyloligellaceae bacterium]
MGHILFLLLIGGGAWAGYRWYQREAKRVDSVLRQAEEELKARDAGERDDIPKLQEDPETGIYQPHQEPKNGPR